MAKLPICYRALAALLAALVAVSAAAATHYRVAAQPLVDALLATAQAADVSILFDRTQVAHLASPRLDGRYSADAAFAKLLAKSGFQARRINAHAFVLVRIPIPQPADLPVPEILVEGHRSQNSDIARHADDIQPYRVVSAEQINQSAANLPEDLFRNELPANSLSFTARQAPVAQQGNVASAVDLRSLGTANTLMLVDGRRMPSIPSRQEFLQPDLNGLPLDAIGRVETIGGTAGGIYGPGATGGVVNIVLKRDLPKAWLEVGTGISDRGDSARHEISGGFSARLFGGETRISLQATATRDDGLQFGDRPVVAQARALYTSRGEGGPPIAPSVNIQSLVGLPLQLIPALGGQQLGASFTSLPTNSGGLSGAEAAQLLANAGRYDLRLSPDGQGVAQSLLTPFKTRGLIGNLTQKLAPGLDGFADLIYMADAGQATGQGAGRNSFVLSAGQAANPFTQDVQVTFPTPALAATDLFRTRTLRATVGLIARLPRGWAAETDLAYGSSAVHQSLPLLPGVPVVDIFSPGTTLADLIATLPPVERVAYDITNRMVDANVRLAGPLIRLPAGPLVLTLTAEYREERTTPTRMTPADAETPLPYFSTRHAISVASAFGEARVPIAQAGEGPIPLRGLELQLAVRGDQYRISEPDHVLVFDATAGTLKVRYETIAFTAGAKSAPLPGVTLRASFATGYLPPTPGQIVPLKSTFAFQPFADPKRPGAPIDFDRPVSFIDMGSPSLKPEHARTLSVGIVVEPAFIKGLRLSGDLTHIVKTREITDFAAGNYPYFIAHEDDYPGRIVRAPLTAADIANGYQAGAIIGIDGSPLNIGRTVENAVDLDLTYGMPLAAGRLGLRANATWTPSLRRRDDPALGYGQLAGYSDGPVRWKGSAGARWSLGGVTASLSGQFINAYHVAFGTISTANGYLNALRIAEQGSSSVRAQAYLDATLGYRITTAGGAKVSYQFGIANLLDTLPPIEPVVLQNAAFNATYVVGYSTYGDPRGRRFEFKARIEF